MTWLGHLVRFLVSAVILLIISAIVPGFSINGFWSALIASVVIALLGWLVESILGHDISPYARGIVGFITSAVILYLTGWILPGVRITFFGALIAALIIGLVDIFVPSRARFTS
jgi:putative membrane protein